MPPQEPPAREPSAQESSAPLVRRSSLREQLMDALREEMVTGRMAAGQRYTVKEIADAYGVSGTPVREAMVQLASEGLLEVAHLRGFQVRDLCWEDYTDLMAARCAVVHGVFGDVSGVAATQPAGRPLLGEDALARARRRGQSVAYADRIGNLDLLVVSDLRFWAEVAALFGNRHLAAFLSRLRHQAWIFLVPYLRARGDIGGVYWNRQAELLDRAAAGDRAGCRALLDDYHETMVQTAARLVGKDNRE